MDARQTIRAVLASFDGTDLIYLEPAIPAKKLANARARCGVPGDEFVVGLMDLTVFGSAKHALVFGECAFYLCASWTKSQPVVHPYSELGKLDALLFNSARTIVVLQAVRAALSRARADAIDPAVLVTRAPRELPDEPDVSIGPEATALQAAIAAAPADDAPQLVLADLLLANGDPRGELIVLHNRVSTGDLTEPEALERYLELAAEYGFPNALPEAPTLPFVRQSDVPIRFVLNHQLRDYEIRYDNYLLDILVGRRSVLVRRLRTETGYAWTADELDVILRTISDAIRAGTPLKLVQFPYVDHPLPSYGGGALRCYVLPSDYTGPRGIAQTRYGLAARDYERWMETWRRLARSLKATRSA